MLLLLFASLCHSQTAIRQIYSIDIFKIAQKNGKVISTARLFVDSEGVIERSDYQDEKRNIDTFSKSMNALILNEQKVVKVDGDNDKRTGIQQPYNGLHVYISIIYQDDFDNEPGLKNKTCYRYRETDVPEDQGCHFFKYLDPSDLKAVKKLLQ